MDTNANGLAFYYATIKDIPLLSQEEEVELAKRVEKGDMEARNELVQHNLRLVLSVAQEFFEKNTNVDKDDIVQHGNLGLIHATEKFDYRKGFKFSTYATYWIRQSISRALLEESRTIRIPVHALEAMRKINRYKNKYYSENYREPSLEEIAKATGLTLSNVKLYIAHMYNPLSLDEKVTKDGDDDADGTREAFISSDVNVEDDAMNDMTSEYLESLLKKCLSEKEFDVIRFRYGLFGKKELTLEQAGESISVTRERARQIQKEAETKLMYYIRRHDNGMLGGINAMINQRETDDDLEAQFPGIKDIKKRNEFPPLRKKKDE